MQKLVYDSDKLVPKPYPGDAKGSFVLGTDSDVLQSVLLKSDVENQLNGRVWFGRKTAGPPGHVHGGCQAALLDEMMGSTAWYFGYPAVAAKIEVSFLEMIPYEQSYELRGKITNVDNRKVLVVGELFKDDTLYASSSGLFIVLSNDQLKKLNLTIVKA